MPPTHESNAAGANMTLHRWGLLFVLWALACRSGPPAAPSLSPRPTQVPAEGLATYPSSADSASALDRIFPEVATPFSATTPIQSGAGFVRRTYVSDSKRVEITIARMGQEPGAFERWVAGSADYPQAALPLPASEANGFLTCVSDQVDSACDLHVQLRSGFHVEAMGNGRVPRADLIELLSRIQLGKLSGSIFAEL
jgi:hypothetical protein